MYYTILLYNQRLNCKKKTGGTVEKLPCTAGFSRRVTFFLFSFKPKRVVAVDLFGDMPEHSRALKLVNFSFKPKKGSRRGHFWGGAGTPFHFKPERINHLLV